MKDLSELLRRNGVGQLELVEHDFPELTTLTREFVDAADPSVVMKSDEHLTIEIDLANGWARYKILPGGDGRFFCLQRDVSFCYAGTAS